MAEKEKPQARIVTVAARALSHPMSATPIDIKDLAGRILADQRNDPFPHKKP